MPITIKGSQILAIPCNRLGPLTGSFGGILEVFIQLGHQVLVDHDILCQLCTPRHIVIAVFTLINLGCKPIELTCIIDLVISIPITVNRRFIGITDSTETIAIFHVTGNWNRFRLTADLSITDGAVDDAVIGTLCDAGCVHLVLHNHITGYMGNNSFRLGIGIHIGEGLRSAAAGLVLVDDAALEYGERIHFFPIVQILTPDGGIRSSGTVQQPGNFAGCKLRIGYAGDVVMIAGAAFITNSFHHRTISGCTALKIIHLVERHINAVFFPQAQNGTHRGITRHGTGIIAMRQPGLILAFGIGLFANNTANCRVAGNRTKVIAISDITIGIAGNTACHFSVTSGNSAHVIAPFDHTGVVTNHTCNICSLCSFMGQITIVDTMLDTFCITACNATHEGTTVGHICPVCTVLDIATVITNNAANLSAICSLSIILAIDHIAIAFRAGIPLVIGHQTANIQRIHIKSPTVDRRIVHAVFNGAPVIGRKCTNIFSAAEGRILYGQIFYHTACANRAK